MIDEKKLLGELDTWWETLSPRNIDTNYSTYRCYFAFGDECQNAYWLQEVE